MDLHAWITQQVDRVEASARAELEYRQVIIEPHDGGPAITGTVTGITHTAEGLQLDIAQYGVEPRDRVPAPVQSVTTVLRRCEADRRILARHRAWPQSNYCEACDQDLTTNLNDCPELLDLAHAHGITPDILASLDRPTPPEPKPATGRLGLADILAPRTHTRDVPAALRGPNWKP
ncbi:predicted protein [Streptomyces viridosporus ATCC 14672]|uniref:Predicted protein n=1 Tax=Streptomyces viridosporus (strain ATCC 14672 / DSM 40746 / JCM 4963 / KCTC 9882 / NRRL B-12104 / FH 1290) TaxID=566461 RepID=D6A4D4_STRV1|nr:hypothetical protein [Streptomyces viridosporus]EFE65774.1 predicted protein [Streptomyces viridosporus ATCC 14672]